MAKISTFECDICKITKQPSNNWWKVFISAINGGPIGAVILKWEENSVLTPKSGLGGNFTPGIFTPGIADAHICGSACLHKYLEKNLIGEPNGA